MGAAIAAFALSFHALWAWLLLVPVAVSLTRRLEDLPPALVRVLNRALRPLLLAAGLLSLLISGILRGLSPERVLWLGELTGTALALLAVALLMGGRAFPAASTLLPVTGGLLVAAALNPVAPGFLALAPLCATALWTFGYLRGPGAGRVALASFVLGAAGLAAALSAFLPWAQPHVERMAVEALVARGRTGFARQSSLGEIESLALSERVVLRAWTARPQRLRAQVLTRFDGRVWRSAHPDDRMVRPRGSPFEGMLAGVPGPLFVLSDGDAASAFPGSGGAAASIETRIVASLEERDGWPMLSPPRPRLLRWRGERIWIDSFGLLRPEEEPARLYGVANDAAPDGEGAGAPGPDADERAPPPQLDPRVVDLAARLGRETVTDTERLDRTIAHLQSGYAYSLEVGRFRTRDPLAEFLFEKRRGYCEYFATAAAVLLRLQGVPTRYVKGLTLGPHNRVSDHFVVREADAHAWIEAYLPGVGWVEADPTPPADFARLHGPRSEGALQELAESLRAWWARTRATLANLSWAAVWTASLRALQQAATSPLTLALLVGLVLTGGVRWALRRRRLSPGPRGPLLEVPGELRTLLRATERHWARCGFPRPPSRGWREHLAALPAGALPPEARQASASVVDAYYRAAFGGRPPSPDELASLQEQVAVLRARRPSGAPAGAG